MIYKKPKNGLLSFFKILNKKSPANTKGNVQQWCMFESPVKQNQLPDGTRQLAANHL